MNSDLIQKLTTSANTGIDAFLDSAIGSVIGWLAPLSTSLLILYLALWGYQHLLGRAQETLQEGFWRIIFIGLILTFALNVGFYNAQVRGLFIGGDDEISLLFGSGGLIANPIDSFFNVGFSLGHQLWNEGGVQTAGYYFMAVLVWVAVALFTAVATFLTMLAAIATAALIALGPIMIMLLLFNATKQFFQTWLAQLFNYGLVAVLTSIMLNIMITFIMSYTTLARTGADPLIAAISLVTLLTISALILSQIPGIAGGLAGGISLSTMGAISHGVNKFTGGGKWLAGNARPTTARRRLQRLRRDKNIVKDNAARLGGLFTKPLRAK